MERACVGRIRDRGVRVRDGDRGGGGLRRRLVGPASRPGGRPLCTRPGRHVPGARGPRRRSGTRHRAPAAAAAGGGRIRDQGAAGQQGGPRAGSVTAPSGGRARTHGEAGRWPGFCAVGRPADRSRSGVADRGRDSPGLLPGRPARLGDTAGLARASWRRRRVRRTGSTQRDDRQRIGVKSPAGTGSSGQERRVISRLPANQAAPAAPAVGCHRRTWRLGPLTGGG
jgi:hypothetical protein